ncbi:U-box domain-containing protein 44 isoform X1 [Dendrobium catenatum]|uniref:RING-type E3 ubiquitin transferase n=1 Tax=Dendrobium catenatum TaxID=906689 RepID=A0A2I0W0Q1_9ASPA|nr:U-box domain-containing protein 44 isoform X1 [Dendrobium catenatum]XP_028554909.1 U-box domain-containing protein 44 isoform X1 [Dendrobium catenatum]XP_028554910.1 U-box domain-containing protein 44 isoform X1 [Dendrobium catenatum]XP_028554911.1 U-box domain-containing protein 44 isoform X1 [Dendrobium catenatum]XP_028554912.1 U-box domain-containing protein 44 isoform X1 [Dendrobium catenatum]PKU69240.1 U-box domain-containing protein 43 [Dendrobium catenatum]
MADIWDGSYDASRQSDESYHERLHVEPIYESFLCPLTKQVMRDPVTIENGHTYEREAIEKWFKECKDSGRRPICPLTLQELNSTDLNSSTALRHTIEEWTQRNDAAQLDNACRSLGPGSSESDTLQALDYVMKICQKSRLNKRAVRNADLIPMIADMLKSSSRKVRCKSLQTLCVVAQDDDNNKTVIAAGDTVRTIVKFLSHDHSQERKEAVSLLFELSKSESLSEKIGGVNGAILILVGLASSKSENILTVEKAEKILENLEKDEKNVRLMAENGRLRPLLTQLLEGSPETQLSMAAFLGELVLSNDDKVFVAQTAGSALVDVMKSGSKQAIEAALKALNQISSHEASAKILIQAGILPPLVKDLFTVGFDQLPMKLKEVSATILANIVASGSGFESVLLDSDHQTLVSEDIVHNLLLLISNTGPAIECKLLQMLVGLTSSSTSVLNIVSAIKSSGATISLIQFIDAPQKDIRMASIKLLHNISPYMGRELSDALQGTAGQLGSLIGVIAENNGITEEQSAAIGFLAELPEKDLGLIRRLLAEEAFPMIISKVLKIRHGEIRGNRFVSPYLEGLVRVLSRITYLLENESGIVVLAQEHNLAALFTDLLQTNGIDKAQMASAMALENLSKQSKHLTKIPELPEPGFCASIFPCFSKQPVVIGLCRIHHGDCSIKESFCLLEGKAVEKLIACLDHNNERVVEAALAALCTVLDDGVDIQQGVLVLCEADGINPILEVLKENRTDVLRQRAVWAVERILRTEDIAYKISVDQNVATALVEAFRHGEYRTRQIAERALKHVDKLPNFSAIYTKVGG